MIGKIMFVLWILGPGGLIYSKSYMVGLPVPCVVGKTRSIVLEKKVALILECQVFKGVKHWSLQPKKEGE